MDHEIKKISKIIDELITFFLLHGTDKMNVSIESTEECYKIHIDCNNINCSDKKVQLLNNYLNSPRQPEVEEYYWELTGESDIAPELSLVGAMIDKAEIDFKGTSISITLYRYK